ncbi:MAG: HAMP domain-containing sensor histidine kinase [Rhodoferax sp.]|nr:HAMP domain-containing sensor histidine kinase [Rhodoferax sp.]
MFLKKLYTRIWLAVVLAVAVLTFLVGWAWRLTVEPPLRDVVIRNEAGQIIGNGHSRRRRPPGARIAARPPGEPEAQAPSFGLQSHNGNGPEFVVLMLDGQIVHMQLPRPPRSPWNLAPFGFFWTLALVALAVALATYPIIRKLTRRLELLQNGVEKWGEGDLSIRVPEVGQDEVAFLATRFNHAAQRIENLVKSHESLLASQKSLLANASHELRSPLTRIRMGLELMGSPSSPTFKNEIARNIAELDQLIEEILLASRLDAREADLGTIEPVDLVGLAAEECARVGAELEVLGGSDPTTLASPKEEPSALPVQGVTKLLRRLMRNLLENARRHAAGNITVTLSPVDKHAVIRVCDRGPGVPPELRERIFEPFYRLPGATERDGGVGLGLALVKSIVVRHGGTVDCENRPEGGACFVVRLPMDLDNKG